MSIFHLPACQHIRELEYSFIHSNGNATAVIPLAAADHIVAAFDAITECFAAAPCRSGAAAAELEQSPAATAAECAARAAISRQRLRVASSLAVDGHESRQLPAAERAGPRTLRQSHSVAISQHRRVLCDQSAEEGRHHRPGRDRVAAEREANLRGGQHDATSVLGESVRMFPD